ncbi:MAG: hypothetical protein IJ079_06020 [Lachnospiraceae bacterium]|nr:hypothetical protein [Lachnospiraceae bacterium]
MKTAYDITDGDFSFDFGNKILVGTKGNAMYDMGNGMALDLESGEYHFVKKLDDDKNDSSKKSKK